jgi:hypothetical protein
MKLKLILLITFLIFNTSKLTRRTKEVQCMISPGIPQGLEYQRSGLCVNPELLFISFEKMNSIRYELDKIQLEVMSYLQFSPDDITNDFEDAYKQGLLGNLKAFTFPRVNSKFQNIPNNNPSLRNFLQHNSNYFIDQMIKKYFFHIPLASNKEIRMNILAYDMNNLLVQSIPQVKEYIANLRQIVNTEFFYIYHTKIKQDKAINEVIGVRLLNLSKIIHNESTYKLELSNQNRQWKKELPERYPDKTIKIILNPYQNTAGEEFTNLAFNSLFIMGALKDYLNGYSPTISYIPPIKEPLYMSDYNSFKNVIQEVNIGFAKRLGFNPSINNIEINNAIYALNMIRDHLANHRHLIEKFLENHSVDSIIFEEPNEAPAESQLEIKL